MHIRVALILVLFVYSGMIFSGGRRVPQSVAQPQYIYVPKVQTQTRYIASQPAPCPECSYSNWVGEVYLYECNFIYFTSLYEKTSLSESHVQMGLAYFQRYLFNKNKVSKFKQRTFDHVFDSQANVFGVYAGIDIYNRFVNLYDIQDTATPAFRDSSASVADIHLGLSYQFRLWDKLLHIVDLGMYYSKGLDAYVVEGKGNKYSPNNNFGFYFGFPSYFSITDHFSLGVRFKLKMDLDNKIQFIDNSNFIDLSLGLAGRYNF